MTELCSHLSYNPALKANLFLAREVLWRVEERMRPQLEAEFGGKSWEIHSRIITESANILSLKEVVLDGSEELVKSLAIASAIYQAKTGHPASDCVMKELRRSLFHERLVQLMNHNDQTHNKDISVCVVGKYLGECLEQGVRGDLSKKADLLRQEIITLSKKADRQLPMDAVHRKQVENSRTPDTSFL